MLRRNLVFACFLCIFLSAHPLAPYLNGPILSVGMGVGRGSVLQSRGTLAKPSAASNIQSHSLQFGIQIQGGDQRYFNPFIGVSYYGYFGYRYLYMDKFARTIDDAASVNRYSLGLGANLLFNVYSKFTKTKQGHVKVQAYGFFGGLLAMVNIWSARFSGTSASYVRNNANIDAVFGINVRYDKFKWSLGIHMPLADETRLIRVPSNDGALRSLIIIDNWQSAELFMNFTRVF